MRQDIDLMPPGLRKQGKNLLLAMPGRIRKVFGDKQQIPIAIRVVKCHNVLPTFKDSHSPIGVLLHLFRQYNE